MSALCAVQVFLLNDEKEKEERFKAGTAVDVVEQKIRSGYILTGGFLKDSDGVMATGFLEGGVSYKFVGGVREQSSK